MSDLEGAKKRLSDTLRDRMQKYWDLMKDWYKRKISKNDFDAKAKFLLGENNVHLHNEFLFSVLVKCQTGAALPSPTTSVSPMTASPIQQITPQEPTAFTAAPIKPPKLKRPKISSVTELPYRALDMVQYYDPPKVQLLPHDLDTILLCSHELLLPDIPTLHTRMLLGAWELELDGVTEEAARHLKMALQLYLKNVIQALISQQTSWKLKQGTTFHYSFGRGPSSRPLLFPLPPSSSSSDSLLAGMEGRVEVGGIREAEDIRVASLCGPVVTREPLNLFNLRDALKVNQHCVPVYSVYSFSMERILAGMWHPSEEEEEQRRAVEQWKKTLEQDKAFTIPTINNYGQR